MSINRENAILILLLGIILLMWIFEQILVEELNSNDISYQQIEEQTQNLYNINMELNIEYLQDASYTHIASVAASKGFTQKQGIVLP